MPQLIVGAAQSRSEVPQLIVEAAQSRSEVPQLIVKRLNPIVKCRN
ncbi:hypothetical protein GMB86_03245 [Terrilactibacillus sp. BCM23-1]|uniref:Uncharacterized protein n=1 Tax=Terrilactibacillus tamarindi TaxID=2599694 RepID=A0A6N8CMB4_9BACI|nr:hypothetical protein [Terrilactibacillus tamarindi]MTT31031.1 hypothetical protein [Terrilactibacillus tamarindi]